MKNFPKICLKPLFYLVRIHNIDLHAFYWDLHHGSPTVEGRTQHATALILSWAPLHDALSPEEKTPHVQGARKVHWLLLESVSSDVFASYCFEWSLFRMYCTHVIVPRYAPSYVLSSCSFVWTSYCIIHKPVGKKIWEHYKTHNWTEKKSLLNITYKLSRRSHSQHAGNSFLLGSLRPRVEL